MQVVHIINDARVGGAQTLLPRLVSVDLTNSVNLVVLRDPDALTQEYEDAFESVTYLNISTNPVRLISSLLTLVRLVRRLRPDVIHSHLLQSDLINIAIPGLRKTARVSTVHTTGLSKDDPFGSRVIARVVGLLSFRFDAVVACNIQCLKYTREMKYKPEVRVIENGTNIPQKVTYDPSARTLITLARWHPMKGYPTLFAAYSQVIKARPEWKLVCYGTGVTIENHAAGEAVSAAGLDIAVRDGTLQLLGPTSAPQQAMSSAAALIISSTYGEASPMVGIEAVASGLPVIATDVGGAPDFAISSELVAEPGSADDLARAILSFIRLSDAERTTASEESRTIAEERFDITTKSAEYADVYRAITIQSRRSGKAE